VWIKEGTVKSDEIRKHFTDELICELVLKGE
jgi:hypothetical protein